MHSLLLSSMPSKEETTIGATIGAMPRVLAGMKLERASAKFHNHKEGGSPTYRLIQEKECSLILTIKIGDLEKDNTWNHFVAWDGKVIFDSPRNCKVNLKSDHTKEGSKAMFKKLFFEKKFSSRDICALFELQCCSPSKS